MTDVQLRCVDCGTGYGLTSGERAWYRGQGFPEPKRCKKCRDARRHGDVKHNDDDAIGAAAVVNALASVVPSPVSMPVRYARRPSRAPVISILALIVLALLLSAGAFAIAWRLPETNRVRIATETIGTTTTGLNLRAGPTARSAVLAVLDPGTDVNVNARVLDWYAIDHLGQAGFVYSRYVTLRQRVPGGD